MFYVYYFVIMNDNEMVTDGHMFYVYYVKCIFCINVYMCVYNVYVFCVNKI